MTPCLHFATWNVHNAPPDEPRRGCDNCGKVRAAHRPFIRRIEVDGWVWCSTARQVEPAISSGEWVEYVPATCKATDTRPENHCCPEHRCGWCAECRNLPV